MHCQVRILTRSRQRFIVGIRGFSYKWNPETYQIQAKIFPGSISIVESYLMVNPNIILVVCDVTQVPTFI